jgi:hypothetical protein
MALVLSVEDDAPVRAILVGCFTEEGFAVREAPGGPAEV